MASLGVLGGLALIVLTLLDGFETMVLPRRVTRKLRLVRLVYRLSWAVWGGVARLLPPGKRRDTFLSLFGPLSLLALFAVWVLGLIVGFAVLSWSLGTALKTAEAGEAVGFSTHLYMSGVTFFTLGYGDVVPQTAAARALAVFEAGMGFSFLAVIIGYVPAIYQAFSRREVTISLLDARAGSPPTAAELLVRLGHAGQLEAVEPLLAEWERWAAEVLESQVSFPVLSFYRSQHDNQSWLATLTMILDTCSLLLAGLKDTSPYKAQLTFAMARHAAVDLALVFRTPPRDPEPDRLAPERLRRLREALREAGLTLPEGAAVDAKLAELRAMYEPFVQGLALYFQFPLPAVLADKHPVDNWQTSAWRKRVAGLRQLPVRQDGDDHAY
jgi:hypothetical protein